MRCPPRLASTSGSVAGSGQILDWPSGATSVL